MHENWDTWRTKRGVIVVGQLTPEQAMGINAWANTMGWILLTDIQSGVEPLMPYADIWLANQTVKQKLLQADIVIQFGSRFISKRINQFLAEFKANFGWWSTVKMQLIQTTIRKLALTPKLIIGCVHTRHCVKSLGCSNLWHFQNSVQLYRATSRRQS